MTELHQVSVAELKVLCILQNCEQKINGPDSTGFPMPPTFFNLAGVEKGYSEKAGERLIIHASHARHLVFVYASLVFAVMVLKTGKLNYAANIYLYIATKLIYKLCISSHSNKKAYKCLYYILVWR